MKLILAAFALISFVNGKSLIIHDDPLLGVKYVDNQPLNPINADFISSGGISVKHENSYLPALEIGIRSAGEQNLKESNNENSPGAFDERNYINIRNRNSINPYISSSGFVNPSAQKLKTDNGIYSKTSYKTNAYLLPSSNQRFHGDEDDSDIRGNEFSYSSKGRTFPLTRSFNGRQYIDAINRKVDNLSELKLKTDNGIYAKTISKSNAYLLPSISNRRFHEDEDDSDIRGNDFLYSSNGRTFPLTRSFNGRQYIETINRKIDNPSEQKLKTDNGIYAKTISKSNAYILPSLLGINNRRFHEDGDDSDIKGNDFLYSNNGRTFPLTRSFDQKNYVNLKNNKVDDAFNPTEQKFNRAYVFILKNDSQVSPNMLYSLLNGAMNVDHYSTKSDVESESYKRIDPKLIASMFG